MALSVETGEVTLNGVSSTTITLATPVPVGESAATVTAYGASSWAHRVHVTATLQTPVSGEYTELLLERGSAEAIDCIARWSVMSHPDWSVQEITATIAAGTAVETFAITSVTLAETFIVQGGMRRTTADLDFKRGMVRSMLTSTTAGEIRINSTVGTGESVTAVLYVVSWTGLTVERGTTTLTGGTHASRAVAITTIDQSTAIINFSYYVGTGSSGDRAFTQAAFTANNQITFTRGDDGFAGDDVQIAYEVVSHDDWTVQADSSNSTGADVSHALSPNVDLARSCVLGSPVQGNSYSTEVAGWSIRVAQHVSSVSAATSTRHDTTGTVNAHVFVVEFAEAGGAAGSLLESNLLRSPLLHSRLVR